MPAVCLLVASTSSIIHTDLITPFTLIIIREPFQLFVQNFGSHVLTGYKTGALCGTNVM